MKSWSLKVKVGAYAALLTMAALGITAAVLLPFLHNRQLRQLEDELAQNADELQRDLLHIKGAPADPTRKLEVKVIPLALRPRYLTIHGPAGGMIYRSPNLGEAVLTPRELGFENTTLLDRECRVGTFHRGDYLIIIGTGLEPIANFDRSLRSGFLIGVPAAGVVVFLGGLLLARATLKPVSEITAAAERIGTHNPDERLPMPPARDEIARLTEVLNRSFGRLQKSFEASQRFSADASHQLKTPVAILRNGLGTLRDSESLKPEEVEEVQALLQQTRRLSTLIDDLLLLAQADAGMLRLEHESLDLAPLVESSLDDLSALVEEREVSLESNIANPLPASADRRRVNLVLQCLTENAAKHTPQGGTICITADRNGSESFVRVGNSGKGIPPEEQGRIFERFHRGVVVGESVRGYGLGLNIARELARAHGGELSLLRSDDRWTEFEFRLPVGDSPGEGL